MSIENDWKLSGIGPSDRLFITHNGKTHSVVTWGQLLGIRPDTIYNRMRRTDDPEVLLRTDNLRGSL